MEEYDTQPGSEKLKRAKKRVDELKGFYTHLMVYLVINAFILVTLMSGGKSGLNWYSFTTAIFWGVGLIVHAVVVFRLNPFFGKAWEERMIQKYMDEDRRKAGRQKRQY